MQTTVLAWHGAFLIAAIGALYRYAERSDAVKSIKETAKSGADKLLLEIASNLKLCLRPVLRDHKPRIDVSAFIDVGGDAFARPDSALDSQDFDEALKDFLSEKKNALAEYRTLRCSLKGWMFAAKVRSWTTLVATIYELLVTALIACIPVFFSIQIGETVLACTLVVTAMLVLIWLLSMGGAIYFQDQIVQIAVDHD